jgi:hypothetical protein
VLARPWPPLGFGTKQFLSRIRASTPILPGYEVKGGQGRVVAGGITRTLRNTISPSQICATSTVSSAAAGLERRTMSSVAGSGEGGLPLMALTKYPPPPLGRDVAQTRPREGV